MKIHVVRKGDTLYEIAQKYGVDLDVLIAANPQIDDPDVLMIGQKIRIPSRGVVEAPPRQPESSGEAASAAGGEDTEVTVAVAGDERGDDGRFLNYTVRPGDTLWEIAHRYGLSLQELIDANPQIENPDFIQVGEVIRIPRRKPPMPPYQPPYGKVHPYPPYGKHEPYPMPHPHPLHPPYPMYPPHPAPFPWGFHWSFVPPSGETGGKCGASHEKGKHLGPWTPFTVWVPYEHSYPFYADMMPGDYGHYPVAPYAAEKDDPWHGKPCHSPCKHPKKMVRGGEELEEQADA